MHSPVAPESKSAPTDFLSTVSVVSISTLRLSEVEIPSAAAMVSFSGKTFSHFDFWVLRVMGVMTGIGTETAAGMDSEI